MSVTTTDYFSKATERIIKLLEDNKEELGIKRVYYGKRVNFVEYSVCVQPLNEIIAEDGIPIGLKELTFSWAIWFFSTKIDLEDGTKELVEKTFKIRKLLSRNKNLIDDETDPARLYNSYILNREFGVLTIPKGDMYKTCRMFFYGKKRISIREII